MLDNLERVVPRAEGRGESVSARPAAPPKILVVSLIPFRSPRNLVTALRESGFAVEVVCQADHPLCALGDPPIRHPVGFLGPASVGPFGATGAIAAAARRAAPAMIVPCDDLAVSALHKLYVHTRSLSLKRLLRRSIGDPRAYAAAASRSRIQTIARALGVRAPRTFPVDSAAALTAILDDLGYPAVIKRDHTWAGEGVMVVGDRDQALASWRRLTNAHTVQTALGKVPDQGVRYALAGFSRAPPMLDVQEYVAGAPANRAVACRDGAVLAGISAVALETASPTGPARTVRILEHPEMTRTAEVIARRLNANGLLGLDFILSEDGARASLLEVNARATPLAAVCAGASADLTGALFTAVADRPPAPRRRGPGEIVALP